MWNLITFLFWRLCTLILMIRSTKTQARNLYINNNNKNSDINNNQTLHSISLRTLATNFRIEYQNTITSELKVPKVVISFKINGINPKF